MSIEPIQPTKEDIKEIIDLYKNAGLKDRPLDDDSRMQQIFTKSNLVLAARENGQLVGILRGFTDEERDGYLADIAVLRERQRTNITEDFFVYLRKHYSTVQWDLCASGIQHNLTRDLNVVQTLYAISLVLGFQVLGESIYQLRFPQRGAPIVGGVQLALFLFVALVLATLGIRFFWGVDIIRRMVLRSLSEPRSVRRRKIVVVHLPILFFHPFLFFVLCRLHADMHVSAQSLFQNVRWFVGVYAFMLLFNAAWLTFVAIGGDKNNSAKKEPETVWRFNNLACGLAAVLLLVASYHCRNNIEPLLLSASVLFFANSAFDLYVVSTAYFLGDPLGTSMWHRASGF